MTPEQVSMWVPLVNTVGVILVLVALVGAIVKGWLWPKHMVETTLEAQHKAATESAEKIGHELSNEMRSGIDRIITKMET